MNEHPIPDFLSAFLDGVLPPEKKAGVEAHIAGCVECGLELNTLIETKRRLAAMPRHPAPPALLRLLKREFIRPAISLRFWEWLSWHPLWKPAGALAAATLFVAGWFAWNNRADDY